MAKISALPVADPLDGSEAVPIIQSGEARRIKPADHLAYIALGAEAARDQAADLVLPQNIFLDVDLAVAEAAVAEGTIFKMVSSATGLAEVRRRTGAGSDILYQEATVAALGAPNGITMIGGGVGQFDAAPSGQVSPIFFVGRQPEPDAGWGQIGAGHEGANIAGGWTVNANGDLEIPYSSAYGNVGSFIVGLDETFAQTIDKVGASVGNDKLTISAYKVLDASFNIANITSGAVVTASIAGTTMTVTAVASGAIAVGMRVDATVGASVAPGTRIKTDLGGGNWEVDIAQNVASRDMTLSAANGTAPSTYFAGRVHARNNGDGTITVRHPSVGADSVVPTINSLTGPASNRIISYTSTSITIGSFTRLRARVWYDGVAWQVSTPAKVKPSVTSFAGNLLTIAYNQAITAAYATPQLGGLNSVATVARVRRYSFATTQLVVAFYDKDNNVVGAPSTDMDFIFELSIDVLAEIPLGTYSISRPNAKLHLGDVYSGSGNLWGLGMNVR